VNLGLDYGVVTDLWDMLRRGHIDIGSELVVGLNYLTLYDDLETNPSYLWHRRTLEPYLYFQRDDLFQLCKDAARAALGREVSPPHAGMSKTYYYGSLSDAELGEKMAVYEEAYFSLPVEDFARNLSALEKVADWCGKNGVRLRVVWMPWNPAAEQPALSLRLRDTVADWCAGAGVAVESIPGPCALTVALSVSGLPTARFTFEGFLPLNKKNRRARLDALGGEERTMVFYEAPHKLRATLEDLAAAFGPDRPLAVCRELTKLHEEVLRLTIGEAAARYAAQEPRGEFVLVIAGLPAQAPAADGEGALARALDPQQVNYVEIGCGSGGARFLRTALDAMEEENCRIYQATAPALA